ncbi:hypothetical protein Tco_1538584 [Tanacetum coccineum]
MLSLPQRNLVNSNVHTFIQPQRFRIPDGQYRSPLLKFRGNSIQPVQTRDSKIATDPEMCMFALTVSIVEPKNIKDAMADSAWIEAMARKNYISLTGYKSGNS